MRFKEDLQRSLLRRIYIETPVHINTPFVIRGQRVDESASASFMINNFPVIRDFLIGTSRY